MKTTMDIGGTRVLAIDSTVEAVGNSTLMPFVSLHGQVTFEDGTRLTGLVSDGLTGAWLEPGSEGRFYVVEGAFSGQPLLVAVETGGRLHAMDAATFERPARSAVLMGALMAVCSVPLVPFVLGLIMFPLAVRHLVRARRTLSAVRVSREIGIRPTQHVDAPLAPTALRAA